MADMQNLLNFQENEESSPNEQPQNVPNESEEVADKIEEQISRIVHDSPQDNKNDTPTPLDDKNPTIEASLENILGLTSESQCDENTNTEDSNLNTNDEIFEENDIENILSSPSRNHETNTEDTANANGQNLENDSENLTDKNETHLNDDGIKLEEEYHPLDTEDMQTDINEDENNELKIKTENGEESAMEVEQNDNRIKSFANLSESRYRLLMKEHDDLKRSNKELVRLNRKYRQQIELMQEKISNSEELYVKFYKMSKVLGNVITECKRK